MYWTSLTDMHAEGNFIWSNGNSITEDLSLSNNQSVHYAEDCVYMEAGGNKLELIVGSCNQNLQYICQYPAGGQFI